MNIIIIIVLVYLFRNQIKKFIDKQNQKTMAEKQVNQKVNIEAQRELKERLKAKGKASNKPNREGVFRNPPQASHQHLADASQSLRKDQRKEEIQQQRKEFQRRKATSYPQTENTGTVSEENIPRVETPSLVQAVIWKEILDDPLALRGTIQ